VQSRAVALAVSLVCHCGVSGSTTGRSIWGFGGNSGTGTGFSLSKSVFFCQNHCSSAPYWSPTLHITSEIYSVVKQHTLRRNLSLLVSY